MSRWRKFLYFCSTHRGNLQLVGVFVLLFAVLVTVVWFKPIFSEPAVDIVASTAFALALTSGLKWCRTKLNISPVSDVYPFLKNENESVLIVLADVPSPTGHVVTGIGEAIALSSLLDAFQVAGIDRNRIEIGFAANMQTDAQCDAALARNVILLGGPNHNPVTRRFMERSTNLEYRFMDKLGRSENGKSIVYSNAIVDVKDPTSVTTAPLPPGVLRDVDVKRDCGMVIRTIEDGSYITVLAGSMTMGVAIAAMATVEASIVFRWVPNLNLRSGSLKKSEFQVVLHANTPGALNCKSDAVAVCGARILQS